MMYPLMRAAVVAVLLLPAVSGAQVYRCDVGGRVVYQSVPCAGGGKQINAAPSSSFGGSADDPVRELRRLEAERERRSDMADADRRYDKAVDRLDKAHCDRIQADADRYREHERSAHRQSTRDWYGAERKAAEARYDMECR